uniref:SFRICE_004036 n=1 Tax=Spodoptera frugiperda TaxID=7108 RepID=A0A2H1VVV7_SPOFR
MKPPEHRIEARPRDMNVCLGFRNELNQKIILLEEKKKKTKVSLSKFNAGDKMSEEKEIAHLEEPRKQEEVETLKGLTIK